MKRYSCPFFFFLFFLSLSSLLSLVAYRGGVANQSFAPFSWRKVSWLLCCMYIPLTGGGLFLSSPVRLLEVLVAEGWWW